MPTPLWNDGTVQFSTTPITLIIPGTNNTWDSYIVENITFTRPAQEINRRNNEGKPSGSVGIEDFVRGTLTGIQLSSGNTKSPKNGYTFTYTIDPDIGPETFILKNPVRNEFNTAENKYNAECIKKYN